MAAEDDVLEAALAAQKRVEVATRAALGEGLRERILAGALAKGAAAVQALPAAPRPRFGARILAACVATALVAGALGYLVGRREVPAPGPQTAPLTVRVPVPIVLPVPLPYPVPPAPPAPSVSPAPPTLPPRHHATADMNEPLLVDQARAALRRKLPDEAIAALERHEREFPAGQLIEEREVLFIEAELMKGQTDAARARIARYLARFPHGLLRAYVESLAAPAPLPQ
jgi:hypothetical protein